MKKKPIKIIISGGGTGGHVFPAISIADAIKDKRPDSKILFVGANGRIEMEKVPAAGYDIIGLPIIGFSRKLSFRNITFIFKLLKSLRKSKKIVKDFQPDVVVGVGGYASGPLIRVASKRNIPALIQEQNSYPGITNKLLSKHARKICVAYENMHRFFEKHKIIFTGNPVRKDLVNLKIQKEVALDYFELDADKKVILIIGGSLGARTLNQSIWTNFEKIAKRHDVQIIWQTGKYYYNQAQKLHQENGANKNLKVMAFISRMDLAYGIADVIVSRAGAGTISELCLIKKPVILVPSPNVTEDHQTKNAMALTQKNAAILVKDSQAKQQLIDEMYQLIDNENKCNELSKNIADMAIPDSASIIADEVLNLI